MFVSVLLNRFTAEPAWADLHGGVRAPGRGSPELRLDGRLVRGGGQALVA